jgi:formate C-acetyltransferase
MARVETPRVGMPASERVRKLREEVLFAAPEVCVESAYWWTESYKETESEPPIIRMAKALAKVLKEMTIHIGDGELIVGRVTTKVRGGFLSPEMGASWLLEEMDTLSTREWDRFAPLTEEEKAKIREFIPYWKGKTLGEKWQAMIPESALRLCNKIATLGAGDGGSGHQAPDFGIVLNKGLNGVRKRVDEELEKLDLAEIKDFEKYQFLRAVKITLEAVVSFAGRYAELARSLAEKEADVQRKAELEMIAETCDWVPAGPARSFYEALQSVWLTYIALLVEGRNIAFGRTDQYLYPFYKKDIAEGRLTREEARELMALFYIKINGLVTVMGGATVKQGGGFPFWPNITLGGLNRNGEDAVNELSYLSLDAEQDVGLPAEEIIIRIHKNTPDAFLLKALETAKLLRGKLKFVGDETTIQQMLSDGKTVELARDYIITGCQTPTVGGYSHDIPGGNFNLPLMLELALNNGVSRLTGEQMGPQTGDPRKFKSYDEVWNAYKKQVETLLPVLLLFQNVNKQVTAEFAPLPFRSALFHGCIEKGIDVTNGGTAPYLTRAVALGGIPNVGDALAAIKKAVFEDKKITMARLIDALDKNFEGEEEILHILKNCPKFGNDDDYVDEIVNDVLVQSRNEATKYKATHGVITNIAAGFMAANIVAGSMVGASPDGRKAGEPLSDAGISPYQGRNVSGPIATMRSATKLDLVKVTNGAALNMKFNPDALKDESKMRKFATLIRTYFETGGGLVQFNIVGTDTLRDAQKYPEKYRDLLVRVATYSARFVELHPDVQNDIIARTEFQEV